MMLRKTLLLAAAALLCAGAAPAKKPVRPSAKAPAAKPAPAAPAVSGPMDVGDPQAWIALLAGLDAKAQLGKHEGDAVQVTVTSAQADFSMQFAGCNAQGRGCQALLFDEMGTVGAPTLPQVNGFTQTQVMCRAYQDHAGKAHVEYSTLLFPTDGRAEALMHLNAWRGCLGDFAAFQKDPNAFLAIAP